MAVNEVRWAAANGCKSLQLPVFPAELGLPDYWDTRYDPLWTAIQDVDLPLCLHIGLKLGLEDVIQRDPTPATRDLHPDGLRSPRPRPSGCGC